MNDGNQLLNCNLPTSARITVNKGAIGNLTATLNSNICRRSTGKNDREWETVSVVQFCDGCSRLNDSL